LLDENKKLSQQKINEENENQDIISEGLETSKEALVNEGEEKGLKEGGNDKDISLENIETRSKLLELKDELISN
jgi:hypothetical protein